MRNIAEFNFFFRFSAISRKREQGAGLLEKT
jgi:hypothetical protein